MRKVIICVHGRARKTDGNTLLEWWKKAIEEGLRKNRDRTLSRIPIEMAYYGDVYHTPFKPEEVEWPYLPAKRGALRPYEEGIIDRLRAVAGNWLDAPMDWLDEKSGVFSSKARGILSIVMKDLAAYYKETETRREVQKRLRDKILHYADREIILITHSMGTIVAYDVLRDLGRDEDHFNVDVEHLITLGSPLGLTGVKSRITHERDRKLRTPTIVTKSWHNFSDPQDVVCFDSHLRDDYQTNSSGVQVKDILVMNDYPKDEHKSFGYLRTPEFSTLLENLI